MIRFWEVIRARSMPTVQDLIQAINQVFPLSRAEKWDKVGLQIGDAQTEVSRVVIAHEITEAVL
ncbi:MAG TPA: Nif3-like dinuclear metal center hexameric protein, partial [Abditibacteriaceae bacterium]